VNIDPETAARIARKAEELEAGLEFSPMASRPPSLRLRELTLEHERRQGLLRWTAIVANTASVVAIGLFVGTGLLLTLVAAAAFVLSGIGLLFAAVRSSRAFRTTVREPLPPRTRATA
jgi:hypothetical protein